MSNPPKRTFYPVTGRSDTGIVAPRLPIEVLQTKDEQFSLFVLSYLIIQDRRGSLSAAPIPIPPGTGVQAGTFFNIGGIHGKPYIRWPGDDIGYPTDYDGKDGKDRDPVPSRFGGYCNHGSVLFPTWHRPYVLLIEQSIGEQATALAQEFDKLEGNNSTKWQAAAKELRFPYWDWAAPSIETEGLPPVLYEDKIPILLPKSPQKVLIDNPMALFPLQVIPSDFSNIRDGQNAISYFKEWRTTLRHPNSAKVAKSRIDEVQRDLKGLARDLRSKVSALFTFGPGLDPNRTWDEFSNHSPVTISRSSRAYHGSIEGVHDSIHDIMGGIGHMAFPDYAGFDPIFFLHHSNVDRLIALWEYVYRNENKNDGYWMGNGYKVSTRQGVQVIPWTQPRGTYSEVYNAVVGPTSGLAPFRTANGEYWTSDQARYLDDKAFKKYYTYETAGVKVDAPASVAERIAARKRLQVYYSYNPTPKQLPRGLFTTLLDTKEEPPKDTEVIPGHRQFAVVVELLEHMFNGPYTFKLFTKPSSLNRTTPPEIVGAVSVFARAEDSPCAGCQGRRAQGATIMGVIFIDEAIVDDLIADENVDTNNLDEIADALKKFLHAELQNPAGTKISIVVPKGLLGATQETDLAPVGIQLVSSAGARKGEDGPVHWVDWTHHGDLFDDHKWKKP